MDRVPVSFEDDEAGKLRRVVLEILSRLPNNDTLRPCVGVQIVVASYSSA